ncbi:MAG: RNA-directed polymerase [Acidobacteriota bacterium]|nr:RNA-directed polymerase [Acidobacteriota bacterium]
MTGSPNLETVSTRLQRIAQLAREDPNRAFLSLAHHIDVDLLREAYRRTRKDGAPGVDGQTAADYEENLEANLQSLLDRFKSGRYQAPPVRRAYVPKGSDPSKKRPIGIPTFEDKVLQRAVAMVLEAVYEQDFLDCSYAFRAERSAHQAIRKLWEVLMSLGGGWGAGGRHPELLRRFKSQSAQELSGPEGARWGDPPRPGQVAEGGRDGRGKPSATRPLEHRRAESSLRCCRTSIFTRCWTRGLRRW